MYKFQINCYPLYVNLSNTTWAQIKLINQLAGNACDSHGTKATVKYRDYRRIKNTVVKLTSLVKSP